MKIWDAQPAEGSGTPGEILECRTGEVLVACGTGAVRVRSVQVHDRDVDVAEAGQRVAVALPSVERSELGRGDVLVERDSYDVSYRLDIELEELAPIPTRVLVHHGTATMLARVVRADRFAQLRLDTRVVAARGDRVVLRAGTTVGGGATHDPWSEVPDSAFPSASETAPVIGLT